MPFDLRPNVSTRKRGKIAHTQLQIVVTEKKMLKFHDLALFENYTITQSVSGILENVLVFTEELESQQKTSPRALSPSVMKETVRPDGVMLGVVKK